jgi:hypothetical protein
MPSRVVIIIISHTTLCATVSLFPNTQGQIVSARACGLLHEGVRVSGESERLPEFRIGEWATERSPHQVPYSLKASHIR